MNSQGTIATMCYDGQYDSLPTKHTFLAWLSLHYENLVGHPDDRMDSECGYVGWHMIVAQKVMHSNAPDYVKYPAFISPQRDLLQMLVSFHLNDDDNVFLDKIKSLRAFLDDMHPDGLTEFLDTLKEIICFHETAPEEIISRLGTAYDAFSWINKQ